MVEDDQSKDESLDEDSVTVFFFVYPDYSDMMSKFIQITVRWSVTIVTVSEQA